MDDITFPHSPSVPLALIIDLEALRHNYRHLCSKLPKGVTCAAVIKANAYGMGLKQAAVTLYEEGCRHFFVAFLPEALELKTYVPPDSFIYALAGLRKRDEEAFDHYNIIPVLNHIDQIQIWNEFGKRNNKCVPAVLHLDTGMSRTGVTSDALKNLSLLDLSNIELMYIMSHLACAYEPDNPMNEAQRQVFDEMRKRFHTIRTSLAASGGIHLGPAYYYDMVRPGIALTGPQNETQPDLKAVFKGYGQVLQVNTVPTGTSVGYNADFIVQRPSRIATIAGGYVDGYLRSLKNRGEVFFRGEFLPVVGCISMDMITVDVTGVDIQTGDWVEFFGDNLPIYALAEKAGTISWEIFSRLGARYERFYLG